MSATRRSLSFLSFAFAAASAAAQPADTETGTGAMSQCSVESLKPLPSSSASARENVIAVVRQANTCVRQQDLACAERAVASVPDLGLSDDERALLAIPRADVAIQHKNSDAAVGIYRDALALPTIGEFARRQVTWRLAALLNARGEFAETLRLFGSAGCETWTAEAWAFRAVAYQSLGAKNFGLESFRSAMKLYELEGRAVPPTFKEGYDTLLAADMPDPVGGPDVVPLVRRNPDYPEQALRESEEGWVHLGFDVTDMGTVENVVVLASRNDLFDSSAIGALQRWRYVPKFENGLPVRASGIETVIVFCLEQCDARNSPPKIGPRDGSTP